MKKKIVSKLMAVVLVFSLVLTGCGSSQEDSAASADGEELTTIRFGVMTGTLSHWLTEIGTEKGIFEKHGLQIEMSEFSAGINTVDAMVQGSLDIGGVADFAGINRIGSTQDETDLRFFVRVGTSNSFSLYANPETVNSLEDLKGKGVVIQLGTVIEYWVGKTLELAGLTKEDVELAELENLTTDLLAVANSGDADAAWANGETAKKLQEDYGWKQIMTQEDLGLNTYNLSVSTEEYLKANQETVQKFIEANNEIMEYVENNHDDAVAIISERTGGETEVIESTLDTIEFDQSVTQEMVDALNDIGTWAYENGFFDKEYDVADYINTDALAAAFPDMVSYSKAE